MKRATVVAGIFALACIGARLLGGVSLAESAPKPQWHAAEPAAPAATPGVNVR